jgi:hypothetical protein
MSRLAYGAFDLADPAGPHQLARERAGPLADDEHIEPPKPWFTSQFGTS